MTPEELDKLAKEKIGYSRQLAVVGKREADAALQMWKLGFIEAQKLSAQSAGSGVSDEDILCDQGLLRAALDYRREYPEANTFDFRKGGLYMYRRLTTNPLVAEIQSATPIISFSESKPGHPESKVGK